jgi:hypothetical protein
MAGTRPTVFTLHLSLELSVAHSKKQTQTNLTSTPVYPPLLYVTHTSRYPSQGADTNLTSVRFYLLLLYVTLPVTHSKEQTQTSLTSAYFYNKTTAHIGTAVRIRLSECRPSGWSNHASSASSRFYDRPTREFSVVFVDPRANAQFASKLHVVLLASHEAPC